MSEKKELKTSLSGISDVFIFKICKKKEDLNLYN